MATDLTKLVEHWDTLSGNSRHVTQETETRRSSDLNRLLLAMAEQIEANENEIRRVETRIDDTETEQPNRN